MLKSVVSRPRTEKFPLGFEAISRVSVPVNGTQEAIVRAAVNEINLN